MKAIAPSTAVVSKSERAWTQETPTDARRTLAPVVADIRAGGTTSLGTIADALDSRGMLTRRGGRWHKSTVMNLLDRLGLREAGCASPG